MSTGRPDRDWRDTGRVAADLAVLGLLVAVAALPVVTAGAAVATGSAAVHHHLEHDRWPGVRFCATEFRRRLLPGLAALLGGLAAVALVTLDVRALSSGRVPGGPALIVVTGLVVAAAAGFGGVLVVAAGAGRAALTAAGPATVARWAGVLAVVAVLSVLIHPVLAPVLGGYTIFALHVVARTGARRAARAAAPSGAAAGSVASRTASSARPPDGRGRA